MKYKYAVEIGGRMTDYPVELYFLKKFFLIQKLIFRAYLGSFKKDVQTLGEGWV